MDIQEEGRGMEVIDLDLNRAMGRLLVNAVVKLWVS
jgi:hypothetical protein